MQQPFSPTGIFQPKPKGGVYWPPDDPALKGRHKSGGTLFVSALPRRVIS